MKIFKKGQQSTSYSVLLVAAQITLCAGMPAVVVAPEAVATSSPYASAAPVVVSTQIAQMKVAAATTTPAAAGVSLTPMVLVPVGMAGGPIAPMLPITSVSHAPAPATPTPASGSVPLAAAAIPAANGNNAVGLAVGSARGRAALKTSSALKTTSALTQTSSVKGRIPMVTSVTTSTGVAAVFATAATSKSNIPAPASVSAAASASASASVRAGRQRLVVTKRDVQDDEEEGEEAILHNLTFTTPSSMSQTVEGEQQIVEDNVLVHMTIHDDTVTNVVPTLAGDYLDLVTFSQPRPNDLR